MESNVAQATALVPAEFALTDEEARLGEEGVAFGAAGTVKRSARTAPFTPAASLPASGIEDTPPGTEPLSTSSDLDAQVRGIVAEVSVTPPASFSGEVSPNLESG